MHLYYIIGACIAVVLFIVVLLVFTIGNAVIANNCQDQIEYVANNSVVVRYYDNDVQAHSKVVYVRITDKNNYQIPVIPHKAGYRFAGLYDGEDYTTSTLYVDSEGYGVVPLTTDILLYPVFVEVE